MRKSNVTSYSFNISDINDHAPQFSVNEYEADIDEGADTGRTVIKVGATDEDAEDPNNMLEYDIFDGNSLGIFDIDPTTGVLSTAKELCRSDEPFFELTLRVRDKGSTRKSDTSSIVITVLNVNSHSL